MVGSDGRNGEIEECRSLERDLRALYAAERDELRASQGDDARTDLMAACVSACEHEAEQMRGAPVDDRALVRSFARAQLRFIPRSTWAGLAGLALLVAMGANVLGAHALPQLFSAAGSLLALICLVNVTRSRGFGMAELESSCRFNAVSVVLARMFAMGVASAAILAVAACSLGTVGVDALRCLLWMVRRISLRAREGLRAPDARRAAMRARRRSRGRRESWRFRSRSIWSLRGPTRLRRSGCGL